MNRSTCKKRMTTMGMAAVFAVLTALSLFLAAPGIAGAKADPSTGDEALIVLENSTGSRWSQLNRLNVFANPKYDGQHMIAPKSSGEYAFTVANSARFPLKYTLQISDENEAGVPMEYRLKQGGKYLAGSDSEWVGVSALAEISNELSHESETAYLLEWRWPGDNDEVDTRAGIAAQDGAKYLLNFGITAEQNGEPVGPVNPPQTGDTSNMALWLSLAVSSGILVLLLIPMKRRHTDDDNTENA